MSRTSREKNSLWETAQGLDPDEWRIIARNLETREQLQIEIPPQGHSWEQVLREQGAGFGVWKIVVRSTAPRGRKTQARSQLSRTSQLSAEVDFGAIHQENEYMEQPQENQKPQAVHSSSPWDEVTKKKARLAELKADLEAKRLEAEIAKLEKGPVEQKGQVDPISLILAQQQKPSIMDQVLPLLMQSLPSILESLSAARERADQRWAEMIAALRPNPVDRAFSAGIVQPVGDVAGVSDVQRVIPTIKDLLSLMKELQSEGPSDEGSEVAKLLELGKVLIEKQGQTPAQIPAPQGQAPMTAPTPQKPKIDIGSARVREWIQAVMREASTGSDPVTVADVTQDTFGLLPEDARRAILEVETAALLPTAIGRWVGPKGTEQLQQAMRIGQVEAWVQRFIEALKEEGEEDDGEEWEGQIGGPLEGPEPNGIEPGEASGISA